MLAPQGSGDPPGEVTGTPGILRCGCGDRGADPSPPLLPQDALKPAFTVTNLPGTTSTIQTAPTTSTSMQASSGPSFPITNYLAPVSASISPSAVTSANGTVLKTTGASAVTSGGLMQIPTGFTLMSGQWCSGAERPVCLSVRPSPCSERLGALVGDLEAGGGSGCCCRVTPIGVLCWRCRVLPAGPAAGKGGREPSGGPPGQHQGARRERKELVVTEAFLSPSFWQVLPFLRGPLPFLSLSYSRTPWLFPASRARVRLDSCSRHSRQSSASLPELEGRSCR